MIRSKSGPISPLQNRTSFSKLLKNPLFHNTPFSILYNMTKTKASRVGELVMKRSAETGKVPYFYLESLTTLEAEQRYQLKANKHLITPKGKYAYVILAKEGGGYELRIGQMHHYYLASKSFEVLAAGDINFIKFDDNTSDIVSFNDHSGGYHCCEEDQLVHQFKKLSCVDIFKAVGLPAEKFVADQIAPQKDKTRRNSL